jgi:hypothetical protein
MWNVQQHKPNLYKQNAYIFNAKARGVHTVF